LPRTSARGLCIFLLLVGEQNALAEADPARDSLTDLPWSDDDNNFFHCLFLSPPRCKNRGFCICDQAQVAY
jgi:hypothetical protein